MGGHHLILGELADILTGETLKDTHDERHRQSLARFLMEAKGFEAQEIRPRTDLRIRAGSHEAVVRVDFRILLLERVVMVVKYGPGSLVTRRRPAIAASRLLAPYQVPLVVVTNGRDAELVETASGKLLGEGLDSIPSRGELLRRFDRLPFPPVPDRVRELESRILYAYEIDDSCPCDDTVCRLP